MVSSSRQPRIYIYIFLLLSYLLCSQICLNNLMDDGHFSYITKLKNKKHASHNSCPLPLAQAKNGKEQRQAQKFLGANKVSQHAPKGPNILFEGGDGDRVGEGCQIFTCLLLPMCFHEVPTGFPTCIPSSECIPPTCSSNPQCLPQHVPNSSSLYPISFALSSTFVIYITNPKG